jgi:glutaredoxin
MALVDKNKLDGVRAKGFGLLGRLGAVGGTLAKVNDALGRPLAPSDELADRRAFETGQQHKAVPAVTKAAVTNVVAAPVIVYYMDKQKRDVVPVEQILGEQKIAYQLLNIEGDAAAQYAVRRDSKGFRLPVVFIAGEALGGKIELINAIATGNLKRLVYGA